MTRTFLEPPVEAHGDHEPPAEFQLAFQGLGHLRAAGGHHDRVEWRVLRPAQRAAPMQDMYVVVAMGASVSAAFVASWP